MSHTVSKPAYDQPEFIEKFTYTGPLGPEIENTGLTLRVWAPLAERVQLRLYRTWQDKNPLLEADFNPVEKGAWSIRVPRDCRNLYYTLEATYDGKPHGEAVDPYATSVAPNGARGFLLDLDQAKPEGWDQDRPPAFHHPTDAVIYELQIRDLSSHPDSGIVNKARFLGLTEEGTRSPGGNPTGLDYLVDLGITHLHLLPIFDFDELDDLTYHPDHYNWGYNPRHFNALKGAFSSNPLDPTQAVLDFRRMVMALHRKGIRVVMDVVYNHTYSVENSHYHKLVPGYYHRTWEGIYSNGSGCGNEVATERPMVRRLILDSLLHWARNFRIRGFRFDLMALIDTYTLNQAQAELHKIDPNFLLYGEGWTGGLSCLPDDQKCLKVNARKTREVAYFSDDTRDTIKGHVFIGDINGFINGGQGLDEAIKFSMAACTEHPQIDYGQLLYVKHAWSSGPHQTVNYFAAHDNHTLYDKLRLTNPNATPEEIKRMIRFAGAILFTLQGIPFLHAGEEFLRTKHGEENSYKSPDSINAIDWNLLDRNKDIQEYFRNLIRFRKHHPALRLRSSQAISRHLQFLDQGESGLVAALIEGVNDPLARILIVYNANAKEREVYLPYGTWSVYIDHEKASLEPLRVVDSGLVIVSGQSAMVLGDSR